MGKASVIVPTVYACLSIPSETLSRRGVCDFFVGTKEKNSMIIRTDLTLWVKKPAEEE
jgi:hypothetical protein